MKKLNPIDVDLEINRRECSKLIPILVELLRSIGLEEQYCQSISEQLSLKELRALIRVLSKRNPEAGN